MSLLDNLRFAIQRRRGPGANAARCGHLDQIRMSPAARLAASSAWHWVTAGCTCGCA